MRIAFPSSSGRSRSQNHLNLKYLVAAIRQGFSRRNLRPDDGYDNTKTGNSAFESMESQKYFRLKISCLNIAGFSAIFFATLHALRGKPAMMAI
ncbi:MULTISPECIES: hypothetical protein [unclassified Rhizobium]|jgi:hypothetical protein|uniref:hypothetical protein n=1 Tax=unclassified Rhizobium TaxID=2613769 RepID=UPI0011C48A9D|nr:MULTISPECIES: hypothetical protein [unclassified Rhizobium]MBN8949352.1 hypothetical protein [Rhizobium tropici]NLR99779.1 hypothetical protein [Rhizobium sp. P38BS-XIX]